MFFSWRLAIGTLPGAEAWPRWLPHTPFSTLQLPEHSDLSGSLPFPLRSTKITPGLPRGTLLGNQETVVPTHSNFSA